MADDVLINKAAAIERAIHRVREVFAGDTRNLVSDQTKQDAIILNLQRACEAASMQPCTSSASIALVSPRKRGKRSSCSNAHTFSTRIWLIA
jgi:hypothetical protein